MLSSNALNSDSVSKQQGQPTMLTGTGTRDHGTQTQNLYGGERTHLLLLDALVDLGGGLLVGPEQADDAGPLGVQDAPAAVPHHQVQLQDPGGLGEMVDGLLTSEWTSFG